MSRRSGRLAAVSRRRLLHVLAGGAASGLGPAATAPAAAPAELRDPRLWPFSADSFWNTPVGDAAAYADIQLRDADGVAAWERIAGIEIDSATLLLEPMRDPSVPQIPLYVVNGRPWGATIDRGDHRRPEGYATHVPASDGWTSATGIGDHPNRPGAVYLTEVIAGERYDRHRGRGNGHPNPSADSEYRWTANGGRWIPGIVYETQPLGIYTTGPGRVATTTFPFRDYRTIPADGHWRDAIEAWDHIPELSYTNVYLEHGRPGAHGGSGLSGLGGSLRTHELMPESVVLDHAEHRDGWPMGPRHALKLSLPQWWWLAGGTGGHRWPARQSDAHARYGITPDGRPLGVHPDQHIGCLRAIPHGVALADLGLETVPGRMLAWTLKYFGAYQVEANPWGRWDGFDQRVIIPAQDGPPEPGALSGDFKTLFDARWRRYGAARGEPPDGPHRGIAFRGRRDGPGAAWFADVVRIVRRLHLVNDNTAATPGGRGERRWRRAPPFDGRKVPAVVKRILDARGAADAYRDPT